MKASPSHPPPEKSDGGGDAEEQEEEGVQQRENDGDTARREWDFRLSTVVASGGAAAGAADTLGVIEIDPTDRILATAGIARKIRIYSLGSLLGDGGGVEQREACEYYICAPAKLSSLSWRPDSAGRVVGAGDYDGVVTEYDLESRTAVFERDEHGGRRVWSVDYSAWPETSPVGASASDDGTAQVWDPRSGAAIATISPSGATAAAAVCCVEFDPDGGPVMAVGSADRRAYLYDLRRVAAPVVVFGGHRRTVTYVRFLSDAMVSAGADGCLKMWDPQDSCTIRTYRGHANTRSFVGLSVWRMGGLLACGSESNEVFVYDKRWGRPIWVRVFGGTGSEGGFVSSVCWRQACEECTLIAGGSDGVLQVFAANRRASLGL